MRTFGTQGPVNPKENYVVARTEETADFVDRVKKGKYIVLFAPEVITAIHKQTAGQPFLVNRCAQILTEEMDIPKNETVTMAHFSKAHTQLLRERNTNIEHLLTNIHRDRQFERLLMRIASYERGLPFSLDNDIMNELAIYGVIAEGTDGMCEIVNPIYQHHIQQNIRPLPSKPRARIPDIRLH